MDSKLRFHIPFNSQGHIGTGPQHCNLWDSNHTEMTVCDYMPNLLTHWATEDLAHLLSLGSGILRAHLKVSISSVYYEGKSLN